MINHPHRALRRLLPSAVAACAAAFSLGVGAAPGDAAQPDQGTGAAQPPAATQPPAGTQGKVSDETLKQFATAAAEVQQIQQDYAAKAQALQKTTQEKIISSVQDAGMTVEQFTALVERVQSDPALAQRLDGMQSQGQ